MKHDGEHARRLIAQQHPDGSWGERFHTLSASSRARHEPTTEMALRRLAERAWLAALAGGVCLLCTLIPYDRVGVTQLALIIGGM